MARERKLSGPFICPHAPPPFLVNAYSKGLSILHKSFRMNICGSFLEMLILKGLRGQKNR
jgi:hypothetical protein